MRILFFARLRDPGLLDLLEFYRQDIEILRELGHDVRVETQLHRAVRVDGDLLWAYWWHTSLPLVALWRARRKPVVVTGAHDLANPDVPRTRTVAKRAMVSVAARLASVNVCHSTVEADALRTRTRGRVEVLYPGLDVGFYQPGPKSVEPTLVTIAQLRSRRGIRRKGVDVSVAAAALARERIPNLRLIVAGVIWPEGQEWISSLPDGVRSATEFAGQVTREAKRSLLVGAWLYLQPSIYEGFGVAATEALACATPVVAYDGGAVSEAIGPGGVVVQGHSADAVAGEIVRLLTDSVTREALGRTAHTFAQRYDANVRRDAVGRLLSSLASH